jgi:hypothetical protein
MKNALKLATIICLAAMLEACCLPLSWQAAMVNNHDAVDAAVGLKPGEVK